MAEPTGDRGRRAREALRRSRAPSTASTSTIAARRGLRPARPERRGQDHDRRDPRGLPPRRRRHGARARRSTRGATATQLRPRIGVMLQEGGLYPGLRPLELLRLFAAYYDDPDDPERLLDLVGLRDVAGHLRAPAVGRAGQRLSLALRADRPARACVFLDEPTAGMDPHARATTWELVRELRDARHHRGAHHARDGRGRAALRPRRDHRPRPHRRRAARPAELTTHVGGRRDCASRPTPASTVAALAAALGLDAGTVREAAAGRVRRSHAPATPELRRRARRAGCATRASLLSELRAGRASLEDVFLRLTGEGHA